MWPYPTEILDWDLGSPVRVINIFSLRNVEFPDQKWKAPCLFKDLNLKHDDCRDCMESDYGEAADNLKP